MQGQQHILAMRKSGYAPDIVFVNDYPCKTDWFDEGLAATVCVYRDRIELLDMRFLVGLTVCITSDNLDRAKRLYAVAKACGAARIGACQTTNHKNPSMSDGWAAIWHRQPEKEVCHG